MGKIGQRLAKKRAKRLERLRLDIEQRGIEAAIDYAKERFADWPKHGGLAELQTIVLDAGLWLGALSQEELESALMQPEQHKRVKAWITDNLGNDATVKDVAAMLLRGELQPKGKRGPKPKADEAFAFIAWQIAQELATLDIPTRVGEPQYSPHDFDAGEVIAKAAGVSRSTARDWIKDTQDIISR